MVHHGRGRPPHVRVVVVRWSLPRPRAPRSVGAAVHLPSQPTAFDSAQDFFGGRTFPLSSLSSRPNAVRGALPPHGSSRNSLMPHPGWACFSTPGNVALLTTVRHGATVRRRQ